MNRMNQFLILIIGLELAISGFGWYRIHARTLAPQPHYSVVDDLTADDLRRLAEDCNSVEKWHELGNIYMSAGFFAESDACFMQVLKLKPRWGDAIYHHAFCLSRYGKTQQANEKFEMVIELQHPQSANAAFFIGRNHLRDENPQLAEAAFLKASKIPMAQFELARLYVRQQRYAEAKQQLEKVLTEQPNASRAKLLLAEVALAENNPNRAISFSSEGSDQTERIASPFKIEKDRLMNSVIKYGIEKNIANFMDLRNEDRAEEAKQGFEMLQSAEWTPHVQDALIKISIERNDFANAERLIDEEISHSGPTTVWLGNLGDVRMQLGDRTGAVEAWTQGAQVRNDVSVDKCYRALARHYDDSGDIAKTDEFQLKLVLDLAGKAVTQGDGSRAVDMLNQALAIFPESADGFYLLGKAQRTMFAPDEAAIAYKKCIQIKPNHGKAIRELKLVESLLQ